MITIASITAITGLTAVGILVLPWSRDEVGRSASAVRAVPEALAEIRSPEGSLRVAKQG